MRQFLGKVNNFRRILPQKPFLFFGLFSVLFGLLFVILIPPFQNPDEYTHFIRSYEVSDLKIAQDHFTKDKRSKGSELPRSILTTYNHTYLQKRPGLIDVPQAKKYSLSQTKSALNIPLDKSNKIFYDTGSDPTYVPLVYIPQALTIKILSLFNAPVILMLYATRLLGLITWVLLALLALKIMKPVSRKFALASILLLPMFIAQASPSTDALLTGLTLIYLASLTNIIITNKILTHKILLGLTGLLAVMVMAKPVYLAFGLLIFLVETHRSRWKDFLLKAATVGLPFVLYVLWVAATKSHSGQLYVEAIAVSHAAPQMQAAYVVPNVFHFFEPFVNTLLLGWGDYIYTSVIGNFGRLDTPLPSFFVILGYIVIAIVSFVGVTATKDIPEAKRFFERRSRLYLTMLTGAIYVAGVYLSMYLYSTPLHEQVITGVQGRYLLPIIPLLVLFLSKKWVIMKQKLYDSILIVLPLAIFAASGVVIFMRYYIVYP